MRIEAQRARLESFRRGDCPSTGSLDGPRTEPLDSACERGNRSSENLTRFLPLIQLVRFNAPLNRVQQTDQYTAPNYRLYLPPLLAVPNKQDKKHNSAAPRPIQQVVS